MLLIDADKYHGLNDYKTILQNATSIRDESKNTYIRILAMLISKTGKNVIDTLNNPDESSKVINELPNIRTQNTFYTTIVAFFKHADLKSDHFDLYCKWYSYARPVFNKITDLENNHISTERQDKGIIPWQQIIEKRDTLRVGSMEHLLLCMYTNLTRRQMDFFRVYLYYIDSGETIDDNITYINMTVPQPYIHITVGKTIKHNKDGYFRDVLADIVVNSLRLSLVETPRKYLFVDCRKKPYKNCNSYMKWSNKILKVIFDNEHMSVNMLRHSHSNYINNIPNITWSQRTMYAKKMGHSVDKQIKYNVSNFTHNDSKNKHIQENNDENNLFKQYVFKKVCAKINP